MFLNYSHLVIASAITVFTLSCGPMNGTPPAAQTLNAKSSCAGGLAVGDGNTQVLSQVAVSQQNLFFVHASFKGADGKLTATPQLNDNTFVIHLAHRDDLSACAKDTQIAITYSRPNAHIPTPHTMTVTLADDGSYVGTMTLKKPGTYDVKLQITDGSLKDNYELQVTL
jgi:hypothetical protein